MLEKHLEVKWQGRAGQEVLSAASVLAEVLAMEGKYVQAFPDFNHDKSSTLTHAYNRLSDSPLRLHTAIESPDIVVLMDPKLIPNNQGNGELPVSPGENVTYIVNTSQAPEAIQKQLGNRDSQVFTIDADTIVNEEIGKSDHIPNIPLMTVLIQCIGWISIDTFKERLQHSLSSLVPTDQMLASLKSVDRGIEEVQQLSLKN